MPFKNMPDSCFKIWEKVYNASKEAGDSEEKAAKKAYGAIKRAGWFKNAESGNWEHKAELQEFSLVISKASYNKTTTDATKQRRWAMVASDTDTDSYNDNMSLELFNDFINRANLNEAPPEEYRSEFWSGGMPYLSVSHYPDLDGDAVPGVVEDIYIDGNRFKAKGYYYNNPLGVACFESVCNDLYNPDRQNAEDKVRVSIAFLDYKHKHKSNGVIFERKSMDDVCPECIKELIETITEGKQSLGKEYLRGHLIHLAHTRVPVNKRTSMEVEKSMVTRLEDAKSIVGEDLADEIDKKAKLVGKSDALVVKSDEEEVEEMSTEQEEKVSTEPEQEIETAPTDETQEDNTVQQTEDVTLSEIVEEAATKKEGDCAHPASHYLVVEDASKPTTWHLRVKNCSGEYDHRLMGAAWAALHEGYRGNKYEGSNKQEATSKLKGIYKREGMETPSKADYDSEFVTYSQIKDVLDEYFNKSEDEIDVVLAEFKSAYDEISKSELSVDEKMLQMQEHYNKLATFVRDSLVPKQEQPAQTQSSADTAIIKLSESIGAMCNKLDMMLAKMNNSYAPPVTQPQVPQQPTRRSFTPQEIAQIYPQNFTTKGSTIDQIVARTT